MARFSVSKSFSSHFAVVRIVFRWAVAKIAAPMGSKPGLLLHPKGEFISDEIRFIGRHYEIDKLVWVQSISIARLS